MCQILLELHHIAYAARSLARALLHVVSLVPHAVDERVHLSVHPCVPLPHPPCSCIFVISAGFPPICSQNNPTSDTMLHCSKDRMISGCFTLPLL